MGFVCFSRIESTRANGNGEASPWCGRPITRRPLLCRIIPNAKQVAVKKLIEIGFSNEKGFFQIRSLANIRHGNIVRLMAFFSEAGEASMGNNGGHLECDSSYKITAEAAEGLCYLHHDCANSEIIAI